MKREIQYETLVYMLLKSFIRIHILFSTDIYIHVTNVNEFNPEFSKTHYTIYVQPDTLVGTSVLTVSADDLDADLDTDKEFYYSLDQTPLGAEYFHVDQQGRVYLVASLLSFSLGQSLSPFTVIVSNPSTPVKSGTAIIQTVIPSSTTTAAGTTTDRNKGNSFPIKVIYVKHMLEPNFIFDYRLALCHQSSDEIL